MKHFVLLVKLCFEQAIIDTVNDQVFEFSDISHIQVFHQHIVLQILLLRRHICNGDHLQLLQLRRLQLQVFLRGFFVVEVVEVGEQLHCEHILALGVHLRGKLGRVPRGFREETGTLQIRRCEDEK